MIFLFLPVFAENVGFGRTVDVKLVRTNEIVVNYQSHSSIVYDISPISFAIRHPIAKRKYWIEIGGWYQWKETSTRSVMDILAIISSNGITTEYFSIKNEKAFFYGVLDYDFNIPKLRGMVTGGPHAQIGIGVQSNTLYEFTFSESGFRHHDEVDTQLRPLAVLGLGMDFWWSNHFGFRFNSLWLYTPFKDAYDFIGESGSFSYHIVQFGLMYRL